MAAVDRSRLDRLLNAEDPPDAAERGVTYEFLERLLRKQKLSSLTTRQVSKLKIVVRSFARQKLTCMDRLSSNMSSPKRLTQSAPCRACSDKFIRKAWVVQHITWYTPGMEALSVLSVHWALWTAHTMTKKEIHRTFG